MLVLDHVTKTFGGVVAVDDVSFEVEAGQLVGLIGPNGAGKSTIFEVVSGFYRPNSGRVLFKGEQIHHLKPHQILKRGLARSFQLVQVFPSFTAYDTVLLAALNALPMKQARKRAEEILEMIGLAPRAERLVYDLVLADQKALELGKVLASRPEMVLLDEVMAGLTAYEAGKVGSVIRRLQEEGMTFLVVEHRMDIITNLCSRIIALNFGRKIAEGTPSKVMMNKDVIESYLGGEMVNA
jgi:branched-chain amino acid transport system ATP-binding protein